MTVYEARRGGAANRLSFESISRIPLTDRTRISINYHPSPRHFPTPLPSSCVYTSNQSTRTEYSPLPDSIVSRARESSRGQPINNLLSNSSLERKRVRSLSLSLQAGSKHQARGLISIGRKLSSRSFTIISRFSNFNLRLNNNFAHDRGYRRWRANCSRVERICIRGTDRRI